MIKKIIIANILILCNVFSSTINNSLNNKIIVPAIDDKYTFLVTGHIYGAPYKPYAQYPSSSILGNVSNLNSLESKFLILCGDIFRTTNDVQIQNFIDSFASNIKFPIFNAVGNHDITDRQKYESYFGKTYYNFFYGTEVFIFLDTELKSKKDIDSQINYFKKIISDLILDDKVKNVLVFSHKLIWSQLFNKYNVVFDNVNSSAGYTDQKYLAEEIINSLKLITKNKNVFWLSGDIGTSWSLPIFYHFDTDLNLTLIANGIGDTNNDFIIKTDINKSNITFSAINISNYSDELIDIKDYHLSYWNTHAKNIMSIESYMKKVKRVLSSKVFYFGFLTGMLIFLIIVAYLFKFILHAKLR